jgi:thiamine biosynthesis lipoprotein
MLAGIVVGTSRELAVATSGTAERGTHVIDPHTGQAPNELASITLTGRRLAMTDAYATAAFAMGSAARDWVEQLPEHEAFAVRVDGTTWATTGWRSASRSRLDQDG